MRNFLFRGATIFISMVFSCTFNNDEYEPLTMELVAAESDTVSPFPVLTFVFSSSVADSEVAFNVLPDPGTVYHTYFNNTHDTLVFEVSGILEGNTAYILTPSSIITARNGSRLYPNDISFEIVTYSAEREPNNTALESDSFSNPIFGIFSPSDDIDCFHAADTSIAGFYLSSYSPFDGSFTFRLIDSMGREASVDYDTAIIPDSFKHPIVIMVKSLSGIDNLHYRLGNLLK